MLTENINDLINNVSLTNYDDASLGNVDISNLNVLDISIKNNLIVNGNSMFNQDVILYKHLNCPEYNC